MNGYIDKHNSIDKGEMTQNWHYLPGFAQD